MDNAAVSVDQCLRALQEEASYYEFLGTFHPSLPMSSTLVEDVEGFKRTIAEKEKDLELAARIGQSLLSKNRILQTNHDELAQLCTVTQDELAQLRHELSMSKEILRIYSLESSDYAGDHPESDRVLPSFRHIQMLQERIRFLEDENNRLLQEAKELSVEAADFETKETEIIHDCVKELAETRGRIQNLTENLKQKTEENAALHEEIELLLNDMVDLQARVKKASRDNEEIKENLDVYKENQSQLATELIQLQDKYDLLCSHARSLEDELRDLRRKDSYIQTWADMTSTFSHVDSLAAELNHSLYHVYNSVGSAEEEQEDQFRKVMDIVRLANIPRSQAQTHSISVNPSTACITSTSPSKNISSRKPSPSSLAQSDDLEMNLGSYFGATDLAKMPSDSSSVTNDDGICDRTFLGSSSSYDGRNCATPDSAMSLGAGSDASYHPQRPGYSDLSTKLQLIKPMEGSQILLKWQQLATPHIGGFLESRPGIYTKGQNAQADQIVAQEVAARREAGTQPDFHMATLDPQTSPKFTFTKSKADPRVRDPSSIFSVSSLKMDKKMAVLPVFPRPTETCPTPGLNLAKLLNTSDVVTVSAACDAVSDLPVGQENAGSEWPRSRHTSGSLTSASRSPSPVALDLPAVPGELFQPLQKLYHRSPVMTHVQSLQMMGKKKTLRESMGPVKRVSRNQSGSPS